MNHHEQIYSSTGNTSSVLGKLNTGNTSGVLGKACIPIRKDTRQVFGLPIPTDGIYGIILSDGKLRICFHPVTVEDPTDIRKILGARFSETYNRCDLIDIMWQIGCNFPEQVPEQVPEQDIQAIQREETITFLLENQINKSRKELESFTPNKLTYYYNWYCSPEISRDIITNLIKMRLDQLGRLIVQGG